MICDIEFRCVWSGWDTVSEVLKECSCSTRQHGRSRIAERIPSQLEMPEYIRILLFDISLTT